MASIVTTINRWFRASERMQAAAKTVMDGFDPSLTPVTVTDLLAWLQGSGSIPSMALAHGNIVSAFAAQTFRLRTGGVPVIDVLSLVDVGGPYDLALIQCQNSLESIFLNLNIAPFTFSAVQNDLSTADMDVESRRDEANIALAAMWPATGTKNSIENSLAFLINAYQVATGGSTNNLNLYRIAMGATVAPAYPGDALNDKIADLFEWSVANKL